MFKSILSTSTWKQTQITTLGTIVNGSLGAFFYIIIARYLGPSDFGLFVICITTLTLIADIADFGTNTGIIRFVSSSLVSDKEKAFKYLKLGIKLKFGIWILVLIVGYFVTPFLSTFIFKKVELISSLRLVMVGVGGALFFTFSISSLQSFQKYWVWNFVNIISNVLRIIIISLLFLSSQLSLTNSLISFIAMPFFGFSLSLLFLPTKKILSAKGENEVIGKFFNFNKWVGIFTIITAVSSRLDTFLNARLLDSQSVGVYAAANLLVQVIPQIVGALGVVAAPKFSSFQNKKDMLVYFKKFQLLVIGLGLLLLISIPIASYIIPFLFGVGYSGAVIPFTVLLIAMIIFLIAIPLHNSIIFYFGRPDVFVWVSVIHLFIIGFVGLLLITNFGVIGTALTVLIGMIFNFLLPLIWFLIKIK